MLGGYFLLLLESFGDIGMVDQLSHTLSLVFIVLQALRKEKHCFQAEIFLDAFLKRIRACFNLAFEFLSVTGVEGSGAIDQFEQDDSDRPDVSFIRISIFLNYLRSHVQRGSADSLVHLAFALELL